MQTLETTNLLKLLGLVIWREARGEGYEGMRAVGHVIRNRVLARWYNTSWKDNILAKNQFTSMSPTDPQYNLYPTSSDVHYLLAMMLSNAIYSGRDPDTTQRSTFYRNTATATSQWFDDQVASGKIHQTVVIGHHTFYR